MGERWLVFWLRWDDFLWGWYYCSASIYFLSLLLSLLPPKCLEIRGSSCRLTTMTRTVKWDYIIRVIFLEFCTILSKPCGRWTEAAWSDQDRSFVIVVRSATPSLRKEPNISVPLGCVVIKKDGWWRCGCHSWSEVKRRMRDETWDHLLCGHRGLMRTRKYTKFWCK